MLVNSLGCEEMVRNMIVVKVKSVVQRGIFGLFLFECLDELKHACYIEGKERE